MVKELFRGLSEMREEPIGVFALIIVEVGDRFDVKELMEEPTSPPPLTPVSKGNNAPRIETHAQCS